MIIRQSILLGIEKSFSLPSAVRISLKRTSLSGVRFMSFLESTRRQVNGLTCQRIFSFFYFMFIEVIKFMIPDIICLIEP